LIIGQKTVGVKAQRMRNEITGSNNQTRYRSGVFHPLMSAPTIPNTITRLKGWKKSPGFNGNRGPLSLYVTLLSATFDLSTKKALLLPAVILTVVAVSLTLVVLFRPAPLLVIAVWALLAVFFGFVSVGLFTYLGQPGAVTAGRLYASVSLYLLLGFLWFALYNLLEAAQPGSFALSGQSNSAHIAYRTFLYFSLETLTTLGYGDILPLTPKARTLAVLEAATGVLYVAVTVARLVADYKREE
jgi:hypothetical protein